MKQNELTIEIPDGKIVDWEESKKQNKIVLKQLTYADVCEKIFENKKLFFTRSNGVIDSVPYSEGGYDCFCDKNNATTEHQLECILAKNQLANVAKYLNDGWKPSKNDLGIFDAWVIYATSGGACIGWMKIVNCADYSNVLFKSSELAQQAIEILGEETVKLALEPLGF